MGVHRQFRKDTEGLTAVIATAMLIGVAILISVAVGVIVTKTLGTSPKDAPKLAFSDDETYDRWTLATSPDELRWNEYAVRASGYMGTVKVNLNDDAGTVGLALDGAPTDLPYTVELEGGHFLDFCAFGFEDEVRITLVHTPTDSVAHQYTFRQIAPNPDCI